MLTTAQYEKQLSEKIATLELLLETQQNDVIISEIIKVIHLMATYGLQSSVGNHLPNLDKLILKVASVIRHKQSRRQSSDGVSVILASEMYSGGGHTRQIEDIVDLTKDQILVVLTDYNGRYLSGELELGPIYERFRGASVVVIPNGDHIDKVFSLTNLINLIAPDKLYISLHHNDSIGYTAAFSHKIDGLKTFFIHHADHQPTLGATLKYDKHLDTAEEYCRNCEENGQENCLVMPLYVKDRGKKSGKINNSKIKFASVGGENKVTFEGPLDHAARITNCLKFDTIQTFVHIGRLNDKSLEKIHFQLEKNSIDPSRFENITWVPSLWEALLDLNIHSLIGTAPRGGGRAAIEAQGAGIPVIYYKGRFAGSLFAIPDLSWANHEELGLAISMALENHSEYSIRSRKLYEECHNKEAFKNCLNL